MGIFLRWNWIKRNWQYILEEAQELGLVFVGGTALNLVVFDEYRASEDIDLYNPDSKGPDNPDGKSEEELVKILSERLAKKGFEIKDIQDRMFFIGPNIKVEAFHDSTPFGKIKKIERNGAEFNIFDADTYAEMKMAALLCRTVYDPRDLVDVFIIHERGKIKLPMPNRECEVLEHSFSARLSEIKRTKLEDLLLFQSKEQIDSLPYERFKKFERWLVEWLSKFL